MYKIYFLVLISLTINNSLNAQRHGNLSLYHTDKRHEVSLGYGLGTLNHGHLMNKEDLSQYFNSTHYVIGAERIPLGVIYANYKYAIKDRLLATLHVGYDRNKSDIMLKGEKAGTARSNYLTVALEAYYLFVDEKVQLYSGAGLGYSLNTIKYDVNNEPSVSLNYNRLAFNATLLGLRYGYNRGVFIESGYGYKGFISIGGFMRF